LDSHQGADRSKPHVRKTPRRSCRTAADTSLLKPVRRSGEECGSGRGGDGRAASEAGAMRVLIVDDDPLFRLGVVAPDYDVQLLLATQVADEHRHIESLLRVYSEVFGVQGGLEAVKA